MLIGLMGALLMFTGDMTLYYSKNGFDMSRGFHGLAEVMQQENRRRLYTGGLIGPVAAWLYCIGYYHLVLMMQPGWELFGWILLFTNSLAIIYGGAYHSHFAYYGLLRDEASLGEAHRFVNVQKGILYTLMGTGFLGMAVCIGEGWTVLPRWMALLSPGILFLLVPLLRKLPPRVMVIALGGWTNLISVIYYGAALAVLLF